MSSAEFPKPRVSRKWIPRGPSAPWRRTPLEPVKLKGCNNLRQEELQLHHVLSKVYHKYPPGMDLVICFAYNSKTWLKAVFVTIILPIAHHKTGEVNNRVTQNGSTEELPTSSRSHFHLPLLVETPASLGVKKLPSVRSRDDTKENIHPCDIKKQMGTIHKIIWNIFHAG